jgi:CheY-like chemotaxis protein
MSHRPPKILIVDDDPNMRKLIRTALYNGLRQIHEAANGSDALRLANEIEPDILLLDIGLPGAVDGLSLCETLLADSAHRRLQVIIVSGSDAPHDIARAEGLDVRVFLRKPFSPIKLATLVSQMESGIKRMLVIPPASNRKEAIGFDDRFDWSPAV